MNNSHRAAFFAFVVCGFILGSVFGCSKSSPDRMQDRPDIVGRMPRPVCEPAAGGGSADTAEPELIADVGGDGVLEIVVSLKDGKDGEPQVKIFSVPGSAANCLLWPTGRGNYLRNGFVPPSD